MRVWNLSLIATLVGTAAWSVTAQSASPEQQRQALELLHQAMSQPQNAPANGSASTTVGVARSAPGSSIGVNSSASTSAPAGMQGTSSANLATPTYGGATPEQHERAIQMLRSMGTGDQLGAPPTPTSPQAVSPAMSTSANANKNHTGSGNKNTTTPTTTSSPAKAAVNSSTPTVSAPPGPQQPTGPRTKQQKLSDLLELYKADKLTPAQYHEQRAKILSEP